MNSDAIASMLVDKVGEPSDAEMDETEELDDGVLAVAEEAMEALNTKDVKAFASALRALLGMV